MDINLLFVGAHDGEKSQGLIKKLVSGGEGILIEPVPWLYDLLCKRFLDEPGVICLNIALSEKSEESVEFFAPTPDASEVLPFGTQLGSLDSKHAQNHGDVHKRSFDKFIEKISVKTSTFYEIVTNYELTSIHTLITDTEGFDARLLQTFPFHILKPKQILFEYKHSDGFMSIGENFINILSLLIQEGYVVRPVDGENCLATFRGV